MTPPPPSFQISHRPSGLSGQYHVNRRPLVPISAPPPHTVSLSLLVKRSRQVPFHISFWPGIWPLWHVRGTGPRRSSMTERCRVSPRTDGSDRKGAGAGRTGIRRASTSVAFLSRARNSQETAAFAAVSKEIKLKVRRLDARDRTPAFHNPISQVLSRELFVCLSIYKIAVETKRRTCDFLLGCQVLSLELLGCITTTSAIVLSRAPLTIGHKISQRAIRDGSPAPPRILGKNLLSDSGHGNSPAPRGSLAPPRCGV